MGTARLHFAEDERLAALRSYEILDTAPDPVLDRPAALAAHACGTPMAAVVLVDADRQWLKATVGLGALKQTPRAWSFTSDAVAAGAPLVITDARDHPRYADNPLVTGEPGARAFAGVPLIGLDGLPLGALCVIDREPRTFDAQALELLAVLADRVVRLLEARRRPDERDGVNAAVSRTAARRQRRQQRDAGGSAGRRLQTVGSICLAVRAVRRSSTLASRQASCPVTKGSPAWLTMPGGAATTLGMAFTAGIAVVVAPSKCSPIGASVTRTLGSPSISST